MLIELRQALISYQDYHMLLLTLAGPSPAGHQVYTTQKLCNWIPVGNMKCGALPPAGSVLPSGSVVIADYMDADVLGLAASGATVPVWVVPVRRA